MEGGRQDLGAGLYIYVHVYISIYTNRPRNTPTNTTTQNTPPTTTPTPHPQVYVAHPEQSPEGRVQALACLVAIARQVQHQRLMIMSNLVPTLVDVARMVGSAQQPLKVGCAVGVLLWVCCCVGCTMTFHTTCATHCFSSYTHTLSLSHTCTHTHTSHYPPVCPAGPALHSPWSAKPL